MFEVVDALPPAGSREDADACLMRAFGDEAAGPDDIAILLYFYTFEMRNGRRCLQRSAERNMHFTSACFGKHLSWLIERGYVERRRIECGRNHWLYYIVLMREPRAAKARADKDGGVRA